MKNKMVKTEEITKNGDVYIVMEYENGTIVEKIKSDKLELIEPQPTQLDRIESLVSKSNEEIAQEAIDNYTDMLMEEGVL